MNRSELSVARKWFSDIDVHKRRSRAMPGNYGRNWLIASEGNTEQLTILVQACLNAMINLAKACCRFASERVPQYTYAGQIQMFKEDAVLLPAHYFELIQGKLRSGCTLGHMAPIIGGAAGRNVKGCGTRIYAASASATAGLML